MDAVLENQHYCVEKHHNRCGPWEGGEVWSMGGRGGMVHGREGGEV